MDRPLARATSAWTALDLVQLHCPPTAVFADDAVFDALDTLVAEQRIAAYGVSVETCDQALTAIARPGVASVQIILNAFRLKPLERGAARGGRGRRRHHRPGAAGLGPAVRASTRTTPSFAEDDHRTYNRDGEAFDVGETFSGVDFETGVEAARRVRRARCPEGTHAGPGGAALGHRSSPASPRSSRAPATSSRRVATPPPRTLPALSPDDARRRSRDLYDRRIRAQVHDRW